MLGFHPICQTFILGMKPILHVSKTLLKTSKLTIKDRLKNYKASTVLETFMLLTGCASTHNNPGASSALPESRIEGNIPVNAPFAKIKIGMGQDQVHSILGQSTYNKKYQTGKMWIPPSILAAMTCV
ncbi:MAG: hypothetical protein PHI13_00525 [Methylococcales bacterium]|nr:hypothetical protein [Methylococcales bacterium]